MDQILQSDYYWWKSTPATETHSKVFQYIKYLDRVQSYRSEENLKHLRLYGNNEVGPSKFFNTARQEPSVAIQHRVTMNIVQSMVDTVVSKITKNKPRPMFLTSGGDWSLQRKAEKLTKFIEGQFYYTKFYELADKALLDGCIFGTGIVKIFRDDDCIKAERVFVDEIIVDDSESIYGSPRQMHQKKWIHREVLKSMFPDKEGAIELAGKQDPGTFVQPPVFNTESDMIMVCESWHLPSGPEAEDGKHVISIDQETLLEEEYKRSYFPFVFFRWATRPLGFFGQGISEQLTGLQLEINKILRTIQVSMHLVSIPKIFVEASSKIVSAHLNNKIGGIIKFAGQKPEPGVLGVIPPELFSHLDRLYQRAFEVVGVSQLAATSAKPAGLNSGKALRIYNDIETERFMSVGKRWEQFFLDATTQFIDLAREIDEETKGGLKVKVKSNKFMESIAWKDVDMDEDKYMMQMFPTSALSTTPAGRLQEVQELLQAGFVGKEDAKKLLNFPDLEGFYNMENAGLEDIERQIELMIDKGEYQTPEPYQNLQLGVVKMQQAYLMYKSQSAPEEKLELFRMWISDADALMKQATAAQASIQASQAPMPTANPAAPPTSDLLPALPQG